MTNQIPLDPKLPKAFDSTPHDERSKAELDAWWDHPYGRTLPDGQIEVRCLNGGAHDRSTSFGVVADYEAACELATSKQAAWLRVRQRPTLVLQGRQTLLQIPPQRPDDVATTIHTFPTPQAAADFLAAKYPDA